MPISDTPLALALALGLAGCAAGGDDPVPDRTEVIAGGRAITVAAPPGFCIDARSTQVSATGAFVLASDCALLGGPAAATPPVGAVMTASVSAQGLDARGPGGLAALERFARTPNGRTMLGRSGDGAAVRVLASRTVDEALYLYVEDRGPQPATGVDPRFWRAFLEIDGRLAALSLLAFENAGPDPQRALDLLAGFVGALRAANPAAA